MIQAYFHPAPDSASSRKPCLTHPPLGARLARTGAPRAGRDPFASCRNPVRLFDPPSESGAWDNDKDGELTRTNGAQAERAPCLSGLRRGPAGRHSHQEGGRDVAK
jgi:hypothetical protein